MEFVILIFLALIGAGVGFIAFIVNEMHQDIQKIKALSGFEDGFFSDIRGLKK